MAKVNAQGLKGAIACASTDTINRPGLQCLLLTEHEIVATNGSVMVIVPWEDGYSLPEGTRVLVRPPKPVPKDRDGFCNVVLTADGATFFGGKASVECDAVDEFFPKYRECVPKDVSPVVAFDPKLLRDALVAFGDSPVTLSLGSESYKPTTLTAKGIVAVVMPMVPGMQCDPNRRWDVLAEVIAGNGDVTAYAVATKLPSSDVLACMRLLKHEGHVVGGPDKYEPTPLPDGLSENARVVAPAPVQPAHKRGPLPKPADRAQRRKEAYALCRERQAKYRQTGSADDLAAWNTAKKLFAAS